MSEKKTEVLKEDASQIYEIGYLLVSSIPEEKVTAEVASLKEILSKKSAVIIAEEAPELRTLAYTMIKKIGASNHRFEQGYFGWFKFELLKKDIEVVKKAFEENPSMLRMLVISTVKEVTYLGKKAPSVIIEQPVAEPTTGSHVVPAEQIANPASVEEMDKSIDEMVKEA